MSAPASIKDSSEHLQQSAEHFRMSLPLLSSHGSDFGPQSYALWFTYVEGTNPALTTALDRFVKEGKRLTKEQTTQLYSSMLAGAEENAIASTHDAFLHLLTHTSASTSAASASATNFGETIQRESAALGASAQVDAERLTRLTEHSNLFAGSLTLLSGQLDQSHDEVGRLRDELQAVRREAAVDGLTRLFNRRTFDDAIQTMCAEAGQGSPEFSLVLVDIDHFKAINDNFGHVFGDRVLRGIADALKAHVKGKDSVSRYGGEEFAVLLPGTPLRSAQVVAELLREAVSRVRIRQGGSDKEVAKVSVSCGVACRRDQDLPTSLIERADRALYRAKNRGRNCVVLETDAE